MLLSPFSNLTALTENQAIPSVAITIKRTPRVLRKPFRKVLFFLDLLDLLQQKQKDIPMTRLNTDCYVYKIINKSASHLRRAKRKPKATETIIGVFCLSISGKLFLIRLKISSNVWMFSSRRCGGSRSGLMMGLRKRSVMSYRICIAPWSSL